MRRAARSLRSLAAPIPSLNMAAVVCSRSSRGLPARARPAGPSRRLPDPGRDPAPARPTPRKRWPRTRRRRGGSWAAAPGRPCPARRPGPGSEKGAEGQGRGPGVLQPPTRRARGSWPARRAARAPPACSPRCLSRSGLGACAPSTPPHPTPPQNARGSGPAHCRRHPGPQSWPWSEGEGARIDLGRAEALGSPAYTGTPWWPEAASPPAYFKTDIKNNKLGALGVLLLRVGDVYCCGDLRIKNAFQQRSLLCGTD